MAACIALLLAAALAAFSVAPPGLFGKVGGSDRQQQPKPTGPEETPVPEGEDGDESYPSTMSGPPPNLDHLNCTWNRLPEPALSVPNFRWKNTCGPQ